MAPLDFPDSGTHRDQCPRSFAPLNCRESRATGLLPKATPLGVLGNRAHRRPPDAAWKRCSLPNGPYRVQLPYRIHPPSIPASNCRRACARFLFSVRRFHPRASTHAAPCRGFLRSPVRFFRCPVARSFTPCRQRRRHHVGYGPGRNPSRTPPCRASDSQPERWPPP